MLIAKDAQTDSCNVPMSSVRLNRCDSEEYLTP
jgi:hypothetical protein